MAHLKYKGEPRLRSKRSGEDGGVFRAAKSKVSLVLIWFVMAAMFSFVRCLFSVHSLLLWRGGAGRRVEGSCVLSLSVERQGELPLLKILC